MRIGVDSGGTFTDCVRFRGSNIEVQKVLSDPHSPDRALEAVRLLAGSASLRPVAIVHGTTIGTNALLERRGARVALVTTAGFEDLIEIGRQNRPSLYDLNPCREPPLVGRPLRFGVAERIAAGGKILKQPSRKELQLLRQRLRGAGAESVAVCLLFSYANPANERTVARALKGIGVPVSVSQELLPEFREYERLSATVINAYLVPLVGGYLAGMERAARRLFPAAVPSAPGERAGARLYVMQSSGGITTAARAAREPVRTILSGPAGGVEASEWLTRLLGVAKAISFDMGGTSTDVCLMEGSARTTRETTVAGLPVAVPVLDVHTVGAGGGSIARLDAGGALRVGPQSAGANPGPACYGRGGNQPTITDAHLILGRLDPDAFLGGGFRLNLAAAQRCFADFLRRSRSGRGAAPWASCEELAAGIVAVGNAAMEKALRVISVERGYDPREFALVCFGGAGGLHAAELARSLGLPRVIVPQHPGAFSALGILLSDIVRDASRSVLLPVPSTPPGALAAFRQALRRRFAELENAALRELRNDRFATDAAHAERRLDLRYRGQSFELTVPFTRDFLPAFHRAHERAYGYSDPARPLEVVSLRVRLTIQTPQPPVRRRPAVKNPDPAPAFVKAQPAWFEGRYRSTRFYDRARLRPGMQLQGPAIITEYSSTTVVPPGFRCRVDEYGNLLLSLAAIRRSVAAKDLH
ncbi:MAG TPA: hydantoinase/oxoprolinase family protein [Terriglobia bacterium]|nr:hydantoinase/oxoprolinase family protein [Terriglobia bacterium]